MARESMQSELLRGTLEMMILRVLSRGENHGYGIAQAIHLSSREEILVEEGTLYPALHRLEKRGDLESEWRRTELKRRAKYYSLTPAGRKRLKDEAAAWGTLSSAISRVLAAKLVTGGRA